MRNQTIDLETARKCNETDQPIEVGMFVAVNLGSGQVLSVASDLPAAIAAAAAIEAEHDIEADVLLVETTAAETV